MGHTLKYVTAAGFVARKAVEWYANMIDADPNLNEHEIARMLAEDLVDAYGPEVLPDEAEAPKHA